MRAGAQFNRAYTRDDLCVNQHIVDELFATVMDVTTGIDTSHERRKNS